MNTEDSFQVFGGTVPSGVRYLHVVGPLVDFWVKVSTIAARGGLEEAFANLQIVTTSRQRARLVEQMSEVRDYPPVLLAEKGGWIGQAHYFNRAGVCLTGEAAQLPAEIAFASEQRGTATLGSVRRWRRRVARPLTGQTLLQFLVLVCFAGPLLQLIDRTLNLLFEVVGPGGEGKSSAVAIAASVAGPSVDRGGGTYWFTPSGTINWLEQCMVAHADATALMNEFQVFGAGETAANRAQMIYDFVFRFSEGHTRGWLKGKPSLVFRGIGVLTGNQSIQDIMKGRYVHLINPTTSRLISLSGDAGRGLGTLDFIPEGYADGRSFISSVLEETTSAHGTAFPEFVRRLAMLRTADEKGLRQQIADHVEAFIARAEGSVGGMRARIAETFAIPYVAGRLARYFDILPAEWDLEEIALESYRRYVSSIQAVEARPVVELLRSYAARSDIINLDEGLPDLAEEDLDTIPGFRRTVGGRVELIVHPRVITRLFADWESRKDSQELRPFLLRDGEHLTRKRRIQQHAPSRDGKDRMHVFTNW